MIHVGVGERCKCHLRIQHFPKWNVRLLCLAVSVGGRVLLVPASVYFASIVKPWLIQCPRVTLMPGVQMHEELNTPSTIQYTIALNGCSIILSIHSSV